MGGGTKTKSTSEQGSAQKWANPYAIDATKAIMDVYSANAPNLAAQSASANDFSQTLQSGYGAAGNVGNAGQGYFNEVMGGKYLSGNPYLQGMIDKTNRSVTDQANSQFTLGGRYGSGAHTGVLADSLAEAQNALRYQDYGSERDRMGQAASGSVAADAARAQAQAQAAQNAIQQQQVAAQIPYTGTESLASALNALFGGGTQTQTTKSGGGIGSILGPMAQVGSAAIMASDPRLKDNVVKIREDADGLGWYEFDYIWSGDRQTGVMADQVAELRPHALGPVINGFATVNYDALEMAA